MYFHVFYVQKLGGSREQWKHVKLEDRGKPQSCWSRDFWDSKVLLILKIKCFEWFFILKVDASLQNLLFIVIAK